MTVFGLGDNDNDIGSIDNSMDDVPQDLGELDGSDNPGEFIDFKYKFKLVTMRSLVVFFTIFSWTGIVVALRNFKNYQKILYLVN